MKNFKLTLFLLFISSVSFAQYKQDTTTLYVNPGYNKDPMRSKWSGKVIQNGEFYELSLTDRKGNLREKISFEDKKLEVRKGPYFFYENGIIKEEGQYDKGYKNGEWKFYYPNQQLSEKVNYTYDKLNGKFRAYYESGEVKKEGRYRMGTKIGYWKMFYENKKLAFNEEYDESGNLVDGIYFDKDGNSVKKSAINL